MNLYSPKPRTAFGCTFPQLTVSGNVRIHVALEHFIQYDCQVIGEGAEVAAVIAVVSRRAEFQRADAYNIGNGSRVICRHISAQLADIPGNSPVVL